MSKKTGLIGAASLSLFLLSLVLLVIGIIVGDVELFLFFIVPVIRFKGVLGGMSFISFLAALMVLFIYLWVSSNEKVDRKKGNRAVSQEAGRTRELERETRWGGLIFIGPIPIVLGDRRTRSRFPSWWVLLLVGIGLTALFYIGLTLLLSL
ncbi:MAG: DUF131 domain-containing protein [Thermoplasmatota archaeon]